ncbi:hypothetical protein Ccrd_008569 [Cynara cardunculus var. scolymus]|uniref:non-specific serine/threonine protein kinase n=1 Tax=Cynara cardunculus var. scolymus TaxID=59895 RepID=A0A124SB42_CYNCS|nr:hypothetical protein Ccrd_008569 [Cynara cardunculus var. scolymus]
MPDTCSLHVNCGGDDLMVTQSNGQSVLYEGDANVDGGAAKLYETTTRNWGFSSTGDFMDDNIYQNTRYIDSIQGNTTLPPLYTTARLSPMTLTYFSYCLENGEYGVDLHFAEIQFTNDSTDFNIEDEAHGFGRSVVIPFNASVTNNILEIRFYWAGKGTTRFPKRGVYGPLVSAIDVNPHFKTCSAGGKKASKGVYIGVGIAVPCLVLLILVFLWRKKCFRGRKTNDKDFEGIELKTLSFSLKQLKSATNNFNASNKVGEGGFGAGTLPDGTVIAVKQLSSHSKQGNREFLNEMGVISCLQHPNLVKLHGCCIEGDQLLLVYELMLDWPTRFKICIGIAKGLAFLHDESRLKIVHRDIKATNVLLDKDLNPKISDFGLARLNEDEKTHACRLETSKQYEELFDERLESKINKLEAETVVKVALLCTNGSPSVRPTMSEVVNMLEGKTCVPEIVPAASGYSEDLRFRAMRDFRNQMQGEGSQKEGQTENSNTNRTDTNCSLTSSDDAFEIHSVDTRSY